MVVESLQVVFKLREVSRSIWLAILYNICRNQLLGCSERRFWARFAPPDIKYALKLTSRIINFGTLDPRMFPKCPQGAPKGRTTGPGPILRVDFEVIFDARIDQISRQFKITKKLTSGRGFWWTLISSQDGQPRFGLAKPMLFVQFSFFDHRLPREQFSGMHVQNELKMSSKMTPEWRRIRGQESMSK